MDIQVVTESGLEPRDEDELEKLLADPDSLVWVDIPSCDARAAGVLSDLFRFHPIAVRECSERNHVSKVHVYSDHVFVILHVPYLGKAGHVHYIELDQIIGPNYLVTVHGPVNPLVSPDVPMLDTRLVQRRIEQGHLHARTAFDLSYAIVNALIRRQTQFVSELARVSGRLEQRVMLEETMEDPQAFLEELFRAWYELLTVRTMSIHSSATYGRLTKLTRMLPSGAAPLIDDIVDQFDRVTRMADGQREFLHGVIEFYRTRTDTQQAIAAEELAATAVQQNNDMRKISAWVAIIAAPAGVTGFFGQNVPYPGFGESAGFWASAVIIVIVDAALFTLFRKKKWL